MRSGKTEKLIKSVINGAAEAHAKNELGEAQFKTNKNARKTIQDDFKSGANWMYHYSHDSKKEDLEGTTDRNMELISQFSEHYQTETGKEIEESTILSFFNA